MNNKTYDFLRWFSAVLLPALTALFLTLAKIWGWPYAEAIGATLAAITTFLGAILGISSIRYAAKLNAAGDDHVNDQE